MTRRTLVSLFVLCPGFLVCGVGALAFAGVILAQAYWTMIGQASASLLAELAIYGFWMALILELAITAAVWVTRGPILALAWVVARAASWQER